MALLERIISMKQQGVSDAQIINTLKEEGITPMEINEAISQSKIKSAIAPGNEMQQSMGSPSPGQAYSQEMPQQQSYSQEMPQQGYSQEQYAQQAYPQEQYAQQGYSQGVDIETIKDISKQQVEEAFKKIKEELSSLSKMKTDVKFEMQNIENRLSQVEAVIHELQSAIIRKMGEYGEAITGISQEVRATQQSFSKILNPVIDQKRGIKSEQSKDSEASENPGSMGKDSSKKTTRNPSAGFENYFR